MGNTRSKKTEEIPPPTKRCIVEGCTNLELCKDYCQHHYTLFVLHQFQIKKPFKGK